MAIGFRFLRSICLVLLVAHPRAASADAHLFADLNPGPAGSGPGPFVQAGSQAFFRAATADGYELWHTDGTPAGTGEVLDIWPGPSSSDPRSLTAGGAGLVFVATDATLGPQVWASDGTAAGTQRLTAIVSPLDPLYLTRSGSLVYFSAQESPLGAFLGVTDGTPAGTQSLGAFGATGVSQLVDFGGTLYFVGGDPLALPDGDLELWRSDGTAGGTMRAVDVLPGAQGSRPYELTVSNGVLYFFAHAAGGEPELWRSLGTPATTEKLATFPLVTETICDGGPPHFPDCFTVVREPYGITSAGSRIYFSAWQAAGTVRLWTSDGSSGGTIDLAPLEPLSYKVPPFLSATDVEVAVVGSTAFFRGTGTELWKSDGSIAGTEPVGTIGDPAPTRIIQLTPAGGLLYFTGRDAVHGPELWRSDGTAAGTIRLTDGPDTADDTIVDTLTDVGGALYFALHDPNQATVFDTFGGYEPWKSDGTPAGTVKVAEIVPGPIGSTPRNFARVNGTLLFAARQPCVAQGWEPFTEGPAPALPPGSCGDGVLDAGEQCDLGDANGTDDDCCRCDCTFRRFDNLFCRMPAGSCDQGGVCNGTSGTCPGPVPQGNCGNGIVDPGEQCDPTAPGDDVCCTACCQFVLPGIVCRASTGGCDPAEQCTGTSAACPADQQSCPPVDPCTNTTPGSLFRPHVLVRSVASTPSTINFAARLQLPPPVDPGAKGLRVIVSAAGTAIVDVRALAGVGWQLRGRVWSYAHQAAGPGEIDKARLSGDLATGRLTLRVRAHGPATPVATATAPITAAVLIDATAASTDQCGRGSFVRCAQRPMRVSCR